MGNAGIPHRERLMVMACRSHGSKNAHTDLPQAKGKNVLYTAAKQHKPSEKKTEQTQTGQMTCAYTHRHKEFTVAKQEMGKNCTSE